MSKYLEKRLGHEWNVRQQIFSSVFFLDFDVYAQSAYPKITSLFVYPHGLRSASLIPLFGEFESPNMEEQDRCWVHNSFIFKFRFV